MGKIRARYIGTVTIDLWGDESLMDKSNKSVEELAGMLRSSINDGVKEVLQNDIGDDGSVNVEQQSLNVWLDES